MTTLRLKQSTTRQQHSDVKEEEEGTCRLCACIDSVCACTCAWCACNMILTSAHIPAEQHDATQSHAAISRCGQQLSEEDVSQCR